MTFDFWVIFVPQLVSDLACFCIHKGRWQVKRYNAIKRVKQCTLRYGARCTSVFSFKTLSDLRFQTSKIFCAELFGQFIIHFRSPWRADLFDSAREYRVFASKVLCLIFSRERHCHVFFFASFDLDQALFEAGNERIGANNQWIIFGCAAVEWFAVYFSNKVHHDLVTIFGHAFFGLVCNRLRGCCEVIKCVLYRFVVGFDFQAIKFDFLEINFWHIRKTLIRHVDFNVVSLFPVRIRHLDFWLRRWTITGCFHVLVHRAVDGFLHRFAHNALAELLAHHCHRNFAFAKALHFNVRLGFFQLFFNFYVHFGRSDRDRVTALKAFVQGLFNLHGISFFSQKMWRG